MADKLLINPIGGLANRMRSIASGVSLAEKMNLDYRIVWPVNKDLNCEYEVLFSSLPGMCEVESLSPFEELWMYDTPRKKNLYLAGLLQTGRWGAKITDKAIVARYLEDPSLLEETVRSVHGTVMIRSGLIYFPFGDDLYRSLFVPRKDFVVDAERRLGEKKKFIGLHIRRTDNAIAIKYSPLELFTEAMEKEITADRDVKFYLATDDDGVKEQLTAIYGDRVIFSDLTAERNTQSGIKEALTEMLTLSMCRKIYGSYWSSFSEAAAMLGEKPFIQLKMKD